MQNRTLIFSKKKKKVSFILSPEDLYKFYSHNFVLSSSCGMNFLRITFPRIEFLNLNCFYAPEFINFRVSVSIVIKQLKLFLKGLLQGFFLEFRIVGLGFKVKKGAYSLLKFVKFDIGFSHFIKMSLPSLIKFGRTKKRFMLFSNDHTTLKIILKNIQNLRKHNPYKTRGLKLTGLKTRVKPGKKQNKR